MIEYLDNIDRELLFALNGNGSEYWDHFMWWVTGKIIWIPTALVFIYLLFNLSFFSERNKFANKLPAADKPLSQKYFINFCMREGLLALIMIVFTVVMCDQISSSFFKPFFERLRPTRNPDLEGMLTIVNDYRGGRYGFISSHAANSIGFATFVSLLFKNRILAFFIIFWSVINSYSRIYLGVHYPGDILAGLALGFAVGVLCYMLYIYIHDKLFKSSKLIFKEPPYPQENVKPAVYTIIITFFVIAVFSFTLDYFTNRPI